MIITKLHLLLADKRMNRTELSKKSGVSLNTLKPIFDGTLTGIYVKTLDRICKALDVQPGDIFQYKSSGSKS